MITAKEARKLGESKLLRIENRIKEACFRGLKNISIGGHLDSKLHREIESLGYSIRFHHIMKLTIISWDESDKVKEMYKVF